MLTKERRHERSKTINALKRALIKMKEGNTPNDDSIERLEKALRYMKENPRVARLSLSSLVGESHMRPLIEKQIFTVLDLTHSDLREVRKSLRRGPLSMPSVLLCLHPEK
jgi:hypothetical protein